MTIREYKKIIKNMQPGERFYLNAISASVSIIEYTKQAISDHIIAPTHKYIERDIKPEARQDFYDGKCILPQCEYIKL